LEQGRAVLLSQALDTRADLADLADRHPALAARFATLRDALDQAGHSSRLAGAAEQGGHAADPASPAWFQAGQLGVIAGEFDRVMAEIRDQSGFADFLRPVPVGGLLAAAADGPVVIVNISLFGAHALILTAAGVLAPVPLNITPGQLTKQVSDFLDISGGGGQPSADKQLTVILGWLWDEIASPVLDRLGLYGPPANGKQRPRLWWCLPGALSLLPVHAAGRHETGASDSPQTVIDRVISSYTPTLRALMHARRSRLLPAKRPAAAVIVAMPHTAGAPDLPGVSDEAGRVRKRLGPDTVVLTGPEASRDTVLGNLQSSRWAHFACHGTVDLTSPSASCLLLTDRERLTVADVSRLRLQEAEIAYLSACSTAQPGTGLADEAIHLASGFHLAGYRHVVGTLWPISDRAAVYLADQFYTAATAYPGQDGIASALDAAVCSLRSRQPESPTTWASHIHIGP
jgi:hypothetical protein